MAYFGSSVKGLYKMNELIRSKNSILLDEIESHSDGVIDMFNTFDPFLNDLYQSQIEPSNFGGSVIAELIIRIVSNPEIEPKRVHSFLAIEEDPSACHLLSVP